MQFENLALFFTDFATNVKIGPNTIKAIFATPEESVQILSSGADVILESPKIVCRTEDVKTLTPGSMIEIGGKQYFVMENRADGTGISYVALSEEQLGE